MSQENEPKRMRLTLQVEGAEIGNIDLERFSNIMNGLSKIAGPGSTLVSYDNYKIVVEGDADSLGIVSSQHPADDTDPYDPDLD